MTICLLEPELVSMIAAGEIVERPASVVKELVENSLDAKASQVSVEILNSGLTLIKVTDNGHGIHQNELATAFQRHATSKLRTLDDLQGINTLGFRGEALPSIAAVADVEIATTASGEISGSYLKFSSRDIVDAKTSAHPQGTTVSVHRLFNTTPARLKFMKSTRAEGGRVAYLMGQFALAFPEVRFTLSMDARTTLRTAGTGDLREAAAQVYSTDIASGLLALGEALDSPTNSLCPSPFPSLSGLISPPHIHRANRAHQSFFVNRRWIYDRFLGRAIDEAYYGLLPSDRYPIVILNLTLSADMVDINVHPTKREIRFRQEHLVFTTVTGAIKQAMGKAPIPIIDFPQSGHDKYRWRQREFSGSALYFQAPEVSGRLISTDQETTVPTLQPSSLRVLGQLDYTYIVAEGPGGLYLVDQHAAHERVLFELVREQRAGSQMEVQGLLQSVLLELTPEEEEVRRARSKDLSDLGFSIEPFGERSCVVRSVPSLLGNGNIADTIRDILASSPRKETQNWLNQATTSLACHGAIKAGQPLHDREAEELLSQLEQTALPRNCPHGRPTMIHLSSGQLHRHFGRT